MGKAQKNSPDLVVADTWMGKHRAKLGISQKAMADLLGVSREQYRAIESAKEPNTWCARLLDLYLTNKGLALLVKQGERASKKQQTD